jgi:mannosyltransferase OCH1-like enzyme
MEFGGIYLDRDVIIIKSLDPLRKFEMTLDYEFHKTYKEMGNQVQIAHKRAQFLRLYLQTYKKYMVLECRPISNAKNNQQISTFSAYNQ